MKTTLIKNALRGIRKSLLSWLSIAIVVMIGCGTLFGAWFYAQSIRSRVQDFYCAANFEDFNVFLSQGLRADEIAALSSVPGVADAEGTHRITGSLLTFHGRAIDAEIIGLTQRISTAQLLEGTLPARDGECALPTEYMDTYGIQVGDTVALSSGDLFPKGFLLSSSFRVTARVNHPDALWSGDTRVLVFVSPKAFQQALVDDSYTYIRVDADISQDIGALDPEYDEALLPITVAVRQQLKELTAAHSSTMRANAQSELNDARAESEKKLSDMPSRRFGTQRRSSLTQKKESQRPRGKLWMGTSSSGMRSGRFKTKKKN